MPPPSPSDSSLLCEGQGEWEKWLEENHRTLTVVWLRLAKKGSGAMSVTYAEALEVALCYGWIDGQKKAHDEQYWLQKFTRRSKKSIWSKINREKVLTLIESGRMKSAGLKEVERARADGRWEGAYDSSSTATVPPDFQEALDLNPKAKAFFESLDRQNRYSILFRIQTAKKAETRTNRIHAFMQMLEKHEKIWP